MNRIIGYYTNDGIETTLDCCDYIQVELLGNHAAINNAVMLVSKNSLQLILQFIWYLGKDGYPITHGTDDKSIVFGRGLTMHKLLYPNLEKGYVVDHINKNRLDNRLTNLRVCTSTQNSYNKSKPKNSTKQYKGITQQSNGLWTAKISKSGKCYKIKDIDDEKEAAHIYDAMAEELFGKYAGKNFE
ncbi:HNH endonuclease with AP2/ERf domain [Fadolivirus algeromassiliense]|jgi:hypothetical protein|uniref:HNH endonuclease with AP2/ERf domain n=1 Tax=Fadolivirus FV1/VV64 TaxID=3070911 RepID=A0A7D3QTU6_9VIRU|nr:HNH endonuclease with AP2/ERf domain [Fadolivirus algeromassiliense]QKF93603.1 HNH endonuclease with AP2/ERf domain [Fadolivirus FV1/VV64]